MELDERLAAQRQHWDARYSTPGRVPLMEPNPRFLHWIQGFDDDREVLVIGDGEGRNARAVPARHPVTMVELSPIGAQRCRELSTRPMEVVVADAFTWLRETGRTWPLVAMLYLPMLDDQEEEVLVGALDSALAAGGGFFLEQARAGLTPERQAALCRRFGVDALVTTDEGEPERITLAR